MWRTIHRQSLRARTVLMACLERAQRSHLCLAGVASRFVVCGGARLHTLDSRGTGNLPAVILLHGLAATATDYAGLIRRLRRHVRRVIAPDLPGHGRSPMPAGGLSLDGLVHPISHMLRDLLDEPAVVFGNSLGGFVAARYAVANPERVHALVLASPAGAPASAEEFERVREILTIDSHHAAQRFVSHVFPRPRWYHQLLAAGVRIRFRQPGVRDIVRQAGKEMALNADEIRRLSMPTLVVWGRGDSLFPPAYREFWHRHLPEQGRLERPGFGHAPFVDEPDAMVDRIVSIAREARWPAAAG